MPSADTRRAWRGRPLPAHNRFLLAGAGLASVGPALGPLWKTYATGSLVTLTLGRLLVVVAGVLLLVGALLERRSLARPSRPAAGLLAGVVILMLLTTANAALKGCLGCAGALSGLYEVAAMVVVFTLAAALVPAAVPTLLVSAALGAWLGAVLALGGVHDVHASLTQAASDGDRLTGTFGNPNFLALTLAAGAPLLLARPVWATWRGRSVLAVVFGTVLAAQVLALSRGGAVALAAGSLVAVATGFATRRAILTTFAVGIGAAVAITIPLVAAFERARTDADYAGLREALAVTDVSGWSGEAQGPLGPGLGTLRNPSPGVLAVRAGQPGSGVSIALQPARAGMVQRVSFDAAGTPGRDLLYAIEDNHLGGIEQRSVRLRPRPVRVSLAWRAPRDSPDVRFYAWQAASPVSFRLRNVDRLRPDGRTMRLGAQLRGNVLAHDPGYLARLERRQIRSRSETLRIAATAFKDHPVAGLGWERFPAYAKARATLGALATHNEYARFLVELGVIGFAPLLGILVALALLVRQTWAHPWRSSMLGSVTAGGVGLLFANALVTPVTALPLTVAVAAMVASRPWLAPPVSSAPAVGHEGPGG